MSNEISISRDLAELCAQCLSNSGYWKEGGSLRDLLAHPADTALGFKVVEDPGMAPNTMRVVQPAAQRQGEPVYQFAVGGQSPSWVDVSEESHDEYKRRGGWLTRVLYTRPAEQPDTGTNSDKYKAELYDEVWQLARDMGFGNVTDALMKLKKQPAPDVVVVPERDESIGTAQRDEYANGYRHGWNAYHDAVQKRLNPGAKPCKT